MNKVNPELRIVMDATETSELHSGESYPLFLVKKPKRTQVKNACSSCQKACKKCDVGRPCMRCIKFNIQSTCIDSVRKERTRTRKAGRNTPTARKAPKKTTQETKKRFSSSNEYQTKSPYPWTQESGVNTLPEQDLLFYQPERHYASWPDMVGGGRIVGAAAAAETCESIYPTNVYTLPNPNYEFSGRQQKVVWSGAPYEGVDIHQRLVVDPFFHKTIKERGDLQEIKQEPVEPLAECQISLQTYQNQYHQLEYVPFTNKTHPGTNTHTPTPQELANSQAVVYPYALGIGSCQVLPQDYTNANVHVAVPIHPRVDIVQTQKIEATTQQLNRVDIDKPIPLQHNNSCSPGHIYHPALNLPKVICDQDFSEMYDTMPLYDH